MPEADVALAVAVVVREFAALDSANDLVVSADASAPAAQVSERDSELRCGRDFRHSFLLPLPGRVGLEFGQDRVHGEGLDLGIVFADHAALAAVELDGQITVSKLLDGLDAVLRLDVDDSRAGCQHFLPCPSVWWGDGE